MPYWRKKLPTKTCSSRYAKSPYTYIQYDVADVTPLLLKNMAGVSTSYQIGTKNHATQYLPVFGGFDIETTSLENKHAYMYIWQLSIAHNVILGRTWSEFLDLLSMLKTAYNLDKKHRIILWIANSSFEWQFMRKHIHVTDAFFKTDRRCLFFVHDDCIEFRDCLAISLGSLKTLAKNYTNTQKCINDLDYKLIRNCYTDLTDIELSYCHNDVLILSEWSEYIFNNYIIPLHYIPLTLQTTIRKDIHRRYRAAWLSNHTDTKGMMKYLIDKQPTEEEYDLFMRYLFRGGYVHGNALFTGLTLPNVYGNDITSSYLFSEFQYMPDKFLPCDIKSINDVWALVRRKKDKRCVIVTATFTNLKARFMHSIESKSKCMEISPDSIIDNGRVRYAPYITVMLTEIDLLLYTKFYTWDNVTFGNSWQARRIRLPEYALLSMCDDFLAKQRLKAAGEEYGIEKTRANSHYGVICTRLNEKELKYNDEIDAIMTEPAKSYDRQIRHRDLLIQWAIYITAHARYAVLSMTYTLTKCGYDCFYSDTDSIKHANYAACKWVFDMYNKRIQNYMKRQCKHYNLNFEEFKELGCYDFEYKMPWFKYQGAKRYICTHYDYKNKNLGFYQTIAGLPKDSMLKEYGTIQSCFDHFEDDMKIHGSGKLTSFYNDEEHSDAFTDYQGHFATMTELSSIALLPADFTLDIKQGFMNLIEALQEEYFYKEKR